MPFSSRFSSLGIDGRRMARGNRFRFPSARRVPRAGARPPETAARREVRGDHDRDGQRPRLTEFGQRVRPLDHEQAEHAAVSLHTLLIGAGVLHLGQRIVFIVCLAALQAPPVEETPEAHPGQQDADAEMIDKRAPGGCRIHGTGQKSRFPGAKQTGFRAARAPDAPRKNTPMTAYKWRLRFTQP